MKRRYTSHPTHKCTNLRPETSHNCAAQIRNGLQSATSHNCAAQIRNGLQSATSHICAAQIRNGLQSATRFVFRMSRCGGAYEQQVSERSEHSSVSCNKQHSIVLNVTLFLQFFSAPFCTSPDPIKLFPTCLSRADFVCL